MKNTATLDQMQAVREACRLHKIWVGSGSYDLNRIHASILQDYRWRKGKPEYAAVVKEMRGHLVLLGKIRKVLEGKGA